MGTFQQTAHARNSVIFEPHQPLLLVEIAVCLAYISLFVFLIYRWRFFTNSRLGTNFLVVILILKVVFGVGLALMYTYYYEDRQTADVFKYYDDSQYMFAALSESPTDYFKMLLGIGNDTPHFDQYYSQMLNWKRPFDNHVYNDHQTMIRVNAFFRLFSFGSFHAHTVFMSFLSLIGLVGLYRALSPFFEGKNKLLAATLFLVPSVLFWCSPVLKEGVVVLGVGLLLFGFFSVIQGKRNWKYVLMLLVSIVLLIYVKIYILLALLPALFSYLIARKWTPKRPLIAYTGVVILSTIIAVNLKSISPQFDIVATIKQKQTDFVGLANGGIRLEDGMTCVHIPYDQRDVLIPVDSTHYRIKAGSSYPMWDAIEKDTTWVSKSRDTTVFWARFYLIPSGSKFDVTPLEPSVWGLLKNAPEALHNALFRPWIFQARGMFDLFAALESLVILIFMVLCMLLHQRLTVSQKNVFWMCLTFSVLTLLLIGWVTPVAGAIVRYRALAYPLFLPAILLLLSTDKIPSKWRKLL